MNVYDAGRMKDVLAPVGYRQTDRLDEADLVILNTCHIREKAAEKMYSDLGRIRLVKKAYQDEKSNRCSMIIAVAGCVAQADGVEIIRRAPYVDLVFGPQTYHRLPEMLAELSQKSGAIVDTEFPAESKFDHLPEQNCKAKTNAFVTIQEGCDKFCTFCVVPYTRGSEFSRPVEQVLSEARRLLADGVRELTLLGQNVNNYHGKAPGSNRGSKEWSLGRLITKLAELEGLERIRYTTSYPADVDEDLIDAHRQVPALMPYLHLPVQSGSDRVLNAMNRRHSATDYLRLIDRLRLARPDLAVSSDFIVGFPGEEESDFQDTLKLVERIKFVGAYSFKYSPRPGTPAARMTCQVEEQIKKRRLAELQSLLNAQQLAFNEECVGKHLDVLLDNRGRYEGQLIGRSPYMQAVHVNAPANLIGSIEKLRIDRANPNSLGATRLVNDGFERVVV